jgi:bifunctional DNA-binding transcriptional regulator/antitoxin component of YhaV-PrlF toxin-antitoxin module
MTYKLKLSSKNQVTIPVALLKALDIDMSKNSQNSLLIVRTIHGEYQIVKPIEELKKLQGSLEAPKQFKNLTDEELEELIEKGKTEFIQDKYGSIYGK